eukprot:g4788.t1
MGNGAAVMERPPTVTATAVPILNAVPVLGGAHGSGTATAASRTGLRSVTLSPSSTFVFLVAICQEWEEGRSTVGDEALYHALQRHAGIPRDQISHVKDRQATKANILAQLSSLLRRTRAGDTLEIYFGGHGNRSGVGTYSKELWRYTEMIEQVEREFAGNRAVFLMDTCHAGAMGAALGKYLYVNLKKLRVSYAFVGATQSDSVCGGAWTLTSSLIDAIKGEHGLDRFRDGVIDFADFVSYTADRHAREKRNRISVKLVGQFRPNTVLFNGVDHGGAGRGAGSQERKWPATENNRFSVGDKAFVKYEGGMELQGIQKSHVYIPPNWYPCSIREITHDNTALVDVKDEFGNSWKTTSKVSYLLRGNYFDVAKSSAFGLYGDDFLSTVFRTPANFVRTVTETHASVQQRKRQIERVIPAPIARAAEENPLTNLAFQGTVGAMAVGAEVGTALLQTALTGDFKLF